MKKLAILAAVLLLVGLPAWAAASTISFDTTTPISLTKTDWTGSLAFPQFDPSKGTLIRVYLHLESDLDTTLQITNNASEASSGSAKTEVAISVRDAGHRIPSTPQIDDNFPFPPYSYNLASGASINSGLIPDFASSDNSYNNSFLLTEFTGNSSISLAAFTVTNTWLSYTGGVTTASQITHADLTGTVTYEYTAVPAPPTLLLLGSGLVGLLALRRRRKASKS